MEQDIEEKASDCDRGRNSLPSVDPRATLHPRRGFLKNVAGVAAGAFAAGLAGLPSRRALAKEPHTNPNQPTQAGGLSADNRVKESFDTRVAAAKIARSRPLVRHQSNNDEVNFPTMIGNYSKGLPHNNKGEVILSAYNKMLKALSSGDPADFERIPLDLGRKLTSPQAGLAFDLEGPDSHHVSIPPAPRIDSALLASEGAELYWMALARDVSFLDYGTDPTIAAAAADLAGFSDFNGPKEGDAVTPNTIFRGVTTGDLIGPYISQFMYLPVPYGPQEITQRNATVLAGRDYMTDFATWLSVQRRSDPSGTDQVDSVPRFLRNLRDLTAYVHMDALYQAYLNACLIPCEWERQRTLDCRPTLRPRKLALSSLEGLIF